MGLSNSQKISHDRKKMEQISDWVMLILNYYVKMYHEVEHKYCSKKDGLEIG
jgi:hypothetical protein